VARGRKKDIFQGLEKLEESSTILRLRRDGSTYAEIAEKVGLSPSTVYARVTRLISKASQLVATDAYETIQRHLDTTGAIIDAQFNAAMAGDTKAAEIILKALSREARLLGLDASERASIGLSYTEIINKLRQIGRKDLLERIVKGEDPSKVISGEIEIWASASPVTPEAEDEP